MHAARHQRLDVHGVYAQDHNVDVGQTELFVKLSFLGDVIGQMLHVARAGQ